MKLFKKLKSIFAGLFILLVLLGAIVLLNDDKGATARVVDDVMPVVKDAASDINQVAKESGIKDTVKEGIKDIFKSLYHSIKSD